MSPNKISNPSRFLLLFILSSVLSFSFIGAMFHYPSGFGTDSLRINYEAAAFGAILGAISGAIVGFAQWFVLRRYLPVNGLWIMAFVLGIALRHAMGDGSPYTMNLTLLPIAGISLCLIIQAFSLRSLLKNVFLWLLIAALSYALGNYLAWLAIDATGWLKQPWTPNLGAMQYALVGGIEGGISAFGTGLGFLWLLKEENA